MIPPILDIQDLVTRFYTYDGVVKALNRVSFQVDHGAFFGLVGESGCGKSVTVRSVMQIVQSPGKIEGGTIRFYPNPDRPDECTHLLELSDSQMQKIRGNRISMIFQEPNAALNPIMTVGEQIAESYIFHKKPEIIRALLGRPAPGDKAFERVKIPAWARPLYHLALARPDSPWLRLMGRLPFARSWDGAVWASAVREAARLLDTLGIPDPDRVVTRYPHQLSGGMKQRVVIAIALASDPVLLIADEATSNLDVTVQAQILDLLRSLKEKKIISSVLLITHDLGVVAETCDRVGVMYAGNLCEQGRVRDVFQNPAHPYTRALLAAVPRAGGEERLASIPGTVPDLVAPPSGCRFHPRCSHAMEKCKEELPGETLLGGDHRVSCWLYGGERS